MCSEFLLGKSTEIFSVPRCPLAIRNHQVVVWRVVAVVRCARQGDDLIPATHLGNPNPPIVQLGWQPMRDHVCFFFVIFVVVHVSALWAWHILWYISTFFFCDCWDSWSLDDTTPVWSCEQVVSRAWEVEKPWLKDEVFGSLDVVFGVFSVGATNVARSRFAMEIKLTYCTIPAIIYPDYPTLDFPQGCTWEKKHKKCKKNWKNIFIPLNVLRKWGHMKFPSCSQPFLFGMKKNTHTQQNLSVAGSPKKPPGVLLLIEARAMAIMAAIHRFESPLAPREVVTSWVKLWMCRLKDDGLVVGWLALLVET